MKKEEINKMNSVVDNLKYQYDDNRKLNDVMV